MFPTHCKVLVHDDDDDDKTQGASSTLPLHHVCLDRSKESADLVSEVTLAKHAKEPECQTYFMTGASTPILLMSMQSW